MPSPKIKFIGYIAAFIVVSVFILGMLDWIFPLALPEDKGLFTQVVTDRHQRPLTAFADVKGVWRYPVALKDISPLYLEALIQYEDRHFWQHFGVNPWALMRAMYFNVRHSKVRMGGSTLTMQVARRLHPHSKTGLGKLHQILRALQLEWHLNKTQILTLYCNLAPFGGTIEGVQTASFTYLNKSAAQLTHAEAALLAVLPQSPTRYRPDLHPLAAQKARDKVLNRLSENHIWSAESVAQAKLETVMAERRSPPHYARLLAVKLARGNSSQIIHTSIDLDLQVAIEDHVKQYANTLPPGTSISALVLNNQNHQVLAYVGAADIGDLTRFGHVDMIQATRSPGSTLKPFLYGLAMDDGLIHSHSLVVDAPMRWGEFKPSNFTGGFSGPVTVADALQRSLNIPAVDILARYGPDRFVNLLDNAGLTLKIPDGKPNLSVILGGAGTSLESLVSLYSALANDGKIWPLHYTTQINSTELPRHFLTPQAAWVIYTLLTGVQNPNGLKHTTDIDQSSNLAWKTGTSYGLRDAWALGVSREYTLGIWVGKPDNSFVPGNTGRDSAAPLLHSLARFLGHHTPPQKPADIEQKMICWPLGQLLENTLPHHCHQQHLAWIIRKTVPPSLTDPHFPNQLNPTPIWINPTTGKRLNVSCMHPNAVQKNLALWPLMADPWLPKAWRQKAQRPPLGAHCQPETLGTLSIQNLTDNSRLKKINASTRALQITPMALGAEGQQHWYLNGIYQYSTPPQKSMSILTTGQQQIAVMDDAGNIDSVNVKVME